MTDSNDTQDAQATQIAELKAKADELGIVLTKDDNIESVTAKIAEAEANVEVETEVEVPVTPAAEAIQSAQDDELLENLKLEAQALSVEVTDDSTVATLSAAIQAVKALSATGRTKSDEEMAEGVEDRGRTAKGFAEATKDGRDAMIRHCQRLTRVQITCNDPKINNRASIQRSVGNSFISINKMIIMDKPVHVPNIILSHMEEETFVAYTKEVKKGQTVSVPRKRPTFNIRYLEPLTAAELNKIATKQRAESTMS